MKLRVLFFSVLRDLVGVEAMDVELDAGTALTVADLLEELYSRYPDLRKWDSSLLIAADLEYVQPQTPLRDGQEIAIMPPVQGG